MLLMVKILTRNDRIEYRSGDVIKMKFVKLWDLLRYSERTTSKTPTRQKLAILSEILAKLCCDDSKQILLNLAWFIRLGTR